MDQFISNTSDQEIKKEKQKARDLRKTQWWKRKCSEGKCFYCGMSVMSKDLTMDHIIPIIRGGKSAKGNVVPACKACNSKKKHSLPMEWEEYMKKISSE
jgi:5-methylcytosine-specific restriction endonuclease McrA